MAGLHELAHLREVPMFQLSIVEHIRLSFASAIAAYKGHADAAWRIALWGWYAKLAAVALALATAVLSVAAMTRGGAFQIAAAAAAIAAAVAVAAYVALDAQPRIYGHRASAARLWLVCEKYRALLSEIHDETLDLPATKERRNALLQEVASILEQGPPADRETYRIAREALSPAKGNAETEIDSYLPPSLRGATGASA